MAINRETFIGNYLEETKENIGRVENGIVKLKKDPENEEELNSVLRALHTIKGSSRMLKFPGIEKTAHGMENLFKGIKEKRYGISNTFVQMVFIGCDLLKKGAEVIRKTGDDPEESPEYMSACEKVYAVEPFEIDEVRGSVGALLVESAPVPAPSGQDSEPKQETGFAAAGTSDYETIRVKLSGIESIMKTMNQIVIKQFQFKQIQESLGALDLRIHEELLDLRKIVSSRKEDETNGIYRNFQESHKELQAIKKSYVDQMAVIERNTYELQAQIMRLTMLPLELILGSLPRMVEEVSSLLGKDVECRISGMDILMDKSILENLNDPIIHIIRNSLDHGIEDPEERAARGKPRMGRIAISCISEGGNIVIRISDDGKGIDYERVKRQALERNLVSKEELDELTESDIYGFLFMPGFSTKSRVTDLSGRGVGLDIVRHNIQKVKGKITIKSVKGEGTEFILALPLSLATVGGFFIRSGGFKFLLPSNFVHKIVRLPKKEKLTYFNKDAFRLEDKIIPIYSLSSAMGITSRAKGDFLYVVVVESVGEFIGVIVDSVIQHANLIYKPLPKNMHKLKLLQGIVFDETYSIINILFIPELIRVFKNMKTMDLLRSKGADRKEVKTVLVVDDSLNTREIEKSILELEDYKVITAVDGIDGLAQLKEAKVDLIISDIDMPRMDGLTMIENIRKEGKYKNIPIVVISSYMEEDLRKKALSIGANAYIVKSEFDRNSLIGIAKKLA